MIARRSAQAGWQPSRPDQFRHTLANDQFLDVGTEEGDLMRIMGWTGRPMVDLYAHDLQVQQAIKAKLGRGDIYWPGPGREERGRAFWIASGNAR